jgi:uncharacterized protein (TIGR02145 family)
VGHCRNNLSVPETGFLYNWPGVMNNANGHSASTVNIGCSGTNITASACRGICPENWHVPTGGGSGEFNILHTAGNCNLNDDACWNAQSAWEGVHGGACDTHGTIFGDGVNSNYWSSTYADATYAYRIYFSASGTGAASGSGGKMQGYAVRCMMNY